MVESMDSNQSWKKNHMSSEAHAYSVCVRARVRVRERVRVRVMQLGCQAPASCAHGTHSSGGVLIDSRRSPGCLFGAWATGLTELVFALSVSEVLHDAKLSEGCSSPRADCQAPAGRSSVIDI